VAGARFHATLTGRPRTLAIMDIGDLVFLGVLLASGVGSVIGASKKKSKGAGMSPKAKPSQATAASSGTGLPLKGVRRAVKPASAVDRSEGEGSPPRPAAPASSLAAPGPPGPVSSPRPRNRWREYVIMKEVLGPPKSMQ
jgi:hypothetical protein